MPLLESKQLQRVDGGTFNWEFLNPTRLLAFLAETDEQFASMLAAAAGKSAPSLGAPWRLVVGFDEFTPGNKLATDNQRKTMVLSFSFLELGQTNLSSCSSWVVPVVLRSSVIAKVVGGWSRVLRDILRDLLFSARDGLSTAGLPLTLCGQQLLLFAKLEALLSDGDGLRIAYDWRGQGSLKPCLVHTNVLRKDCCVMLLFDV
jgi:hypothetical protein